jgi:dihydroflavonol-4-reductase
MPKVFITGGTGFIGSHIAEVFLDKGWQVRCLVRPHHKSLGWLEKKPVEIARGDLLNTTLIGKMIEDVDYIVHCAGVTKAKNRLQYFAGNVTPTQNLLDAAMYSKRLKKICYVSSQTVIGPSKSGDPLTEKDACHPITSYAKSKLEAEHRCEKMIRKLPIVIVRPSAVYGPRDTDILEIFRWVVRGFNPILGSPQKTLSLVYAPDLAEAIYQATASERTTGETYFVADGTIFTFSSVIDYISSLANKRTIAVHFPKELVYSMAGISQFFSVFSKKPAVLNIEKARDLLQDHWVCSPQKIYDHIGYRTATSVFDGLNNTLQWYKQHKWL